MSAPDPYRVLGVSPTASDAEVKAAWLSRVTACHPDRAQSEGAEAVKRAEEETKRVNAALSEIRARRQRGERGSAAQPSPRGPSPEARPRRPPPPKPRDPGEPREAQEALRMAERTVETVEAAAAEARRLAQRSARAPRATPLTASLTTRAREAESVTRDLEALAASLEAEATARLREGGFERAYASLNAARAAHAEGRVSAAREALSAAESVALSDLARALLRTEDLLVERRKQAAKWVRLVESTRDELVQRQGVATESAAQARAASVALPAAEAKWRDVMVKADVAVARAGGLVEVQAAMPGLEPLLVQQWRTRAQALRQALERLRPPEQTERAARSAGGGPVEVATEVFVQAAKRARAAFERLRPLFEAGAHALAQRLTAALQAELSAARAEILGPAAAGRR